MDVSLRAKMKELEAENARLRKMYVEEKIKAEIVVEALAKNVCGGLLCGSPARAVASGYALRANACRHEKPTTVRFSLVHCT
jgi:hypothetical protein